MPASPRLVRQLDGANGTEIWRRQVGEFSEFDAFTSAKSDSEGNLVVVGVSGQIDTIDLVVLKLSGTNGSTLWEYSPLSRTSIDVLRSLDVDVEGNVYVAGGIGAGNLHGHMAEKPVVLKLSGSTGAPLWTYEGPAPSRAVFKSVSVDRITGAVVGAGNTEGTWLEGATRGGNDFAAVILNGTTGEELSRYQDGTVVDDYLSFAGFDAQGALLVGGGSAVGGVADVVAIKFGESQDSAEEVLADWKQFFAEAQEEDLAWWEVGPLKGLAEWEINAILGGIALLLLILACECWRNEPWGNSKNQVPSTLLFY